MKCFSSFLFRNQNLCLQKKRDGPSPLSMNVNWCPNIRLSIRPLSVGKIVPLFIIVTSCPRPSIRVRLYQRTGSDQVGPVHAFWSENSKNISWPSLFSFAYMAGWVNWSHPKIPVFFVRCLSVACRRRMRVTRETKSMCDRCRGRLSGAQHRRWRTHHQGQPFQGQVSIQLPGPWEPLPMVMVFVIMRMPWCVLTRRVGMATPTVAKVARPSSSALVFCGERRRMTDRWMVATPVAPGPA